MEKFSGSSSCKRICAVCGKKTGNYKAWCYVDGIEITVPVCRNCNDRMGWCLDTSMDIHLKSIKESVRHSIIITGDEKYINELRQELAEIKGE